jgi:hypothetical protein
MILAPSLIKNYVVKNSPELIGRQISLDKLTYNYFTSTASAYNFKMYESNGKDDFISFDTLIIDLEPLKYFQDIKEIEQFYVKGLTVSIIMQDSTFNFDDLIEFHSSEDSTALSDDPANDVFKYAISNIALKKSNFYFDNRNVDKLTEIEDFDFSMPFIGWDQQEKSNADLKFDLKNGGYVRSDLNINPNSGDFDALIELNKFVIDPFYKYALEYAEINSIKGLLNAQIEISGNTNKAIESIVSGYVEVSNFEMTDTNDKRFLGADLITCDLDKIDYSNSNYQLGKLAFNNSYTFFQLDSMSNNFFRIFKLEENDDSDANTENSQTVSTVLSDSTGSVGNLKYGLRQLVVDNGVLDYTDNLTGQPFSYHLSDIKIDSKDLNNSLDWLNINATMLLNNRGNLVAEVGLNPNDYYRNINFDIAIQNFLLPDLNIYTNYYMGHSILEGDMYYTSKSTISNGLINSDNKLLVKNAKLETAGTGLYSLPLKFAFFLLTDKNGDVNLDIPVEGNVDDPEVDVGTIVWSTFKNVINKTVAAPVNFLAGLVGGDPKDLEELTFKYTDTMPSDRQYRQLDKLMELEQKKNELAISMTYFVDPQLQKEAIARELVGQEFNTKRRNYLNDEQKFEDYVFKKVKTDSLSFNAAILALTKDVNLDSLSARRSQNLIQQVQNYIIGQRPDSKIQVEKGDPEAPENVGAYPKFMISYGMADSSK